MGIQINTGHSGEARVLKSEASEVICDVVRNARIASSNSATLPRNNGEKATSRSDSAYVGLGDLLRSDYRRYRATGAHNAFSVIALTQGFWASSAFRVSHWALDRVQSRGLRPIIKAVCLLVQKLIEIVAGISIPAQCEIGRGLYIGHFGGIFVDSHSRLGENCNLAQGVTIGQGGRGELLGVPVIGNRVHVGTNAVILGRITIGDDAVIGPGAVVMSSVPPCGVAIGNPARVVGFGGSFDIVQYDEMETDPARKSALQNPNGRTSAAGGASWNG